MSWWDGPLVGFDTETTGVDVETDRIVSAAVAVITPSRKVIEKSWLLAPGVDIPDEATAIHGITTDRARAEGMDPKVALEQIIACLVEEARAEAPLVVFNARFDLTLLDREAHRHGLASLTDQARVAVIDPLVIDKWLHRFRKGSRKLDAICAHMGAKLGDAHDATSDALAACRTAYVIGSRGEPVREIRGLKDVQELQELQEEWQRVHDDPFLLHDAQVRWAAQQAESLEEYFRKQGKDEQVQRAWPIVPREDS